MTDQDVKMEVCEAGDSDHDRQQVHEFENVEKLPPAVASAMGKQDVLVNSFYVDYGGSEVHHYRVEAMRITKNGKISDATRGPKEDFAKQVRKEALYAVLKEAYENNIEMFCDKKHLAYDGANILFTVQKMKFHDHEFTMNVQDMSRKKRVGTIFGPQSQISLRIVLVESFSPALSSTDLTSNRRTLQFFEVVLGAHVAGYGDHISIDNKCYHKDNNDKFLEGATVVKGGFEKSCRVVNDESGNLRVMFQIDAKKSPFFKDETLIKFLKMQSNCDVRDKDVRDLMSKMRDPRMMSFIKKTLKGLAVRTTHLEIPHYFYISDIHDRNAQQCTFKSADGTSMTVEEYFLERYKIQLKHPEMLLAVERKPQSLSFYPMEVLEVPRGQRVSSAKSTPKMGEKMIRECQLKPIDMIQHIETECDRGGLLHNKILDAFGIKVKESMMIAPSKQLFPPSIVYQQNSAQPDPKWRAGRFVKPATVPRNFDFIIFDNCCRVDDADRFLGRLNSAARDKGVVWQYRGDEHIHQFRSSDEEKCYELMRKSDFVMFVTREKTDEMHNVMKHMEARSGTVCQHLSMRTMSNNGWQTMENLVLKLNLKLGGINNNLEMSSRFLSANASRSDLKEVLSAKGRMIVGFEVQHAGALSMADRQILKQNKFRTEPSVAAIAYTRTTYTDLGGNYWYQTPGLARITNIGLELTKAVEDYKDKVKAFPREIIVFRGGLSEGEFAKAQEEMRDARREMSEAIKGYNPPMTCIVVQTNSNYRLLKPKRNIDPRSNAPQQNVPYGTVVDTSVVQPVFNEFIITPHVALQGTVRPLRCTIVDLHRLHDGNTMTMDVAEQLTNILCYGHQVVTGVTGMPNVNYAATNLTKRGKANWKAENDLNDDNMSRSSGHLSSTPVDVEELNRKLQSKATTHYWA